MSAQFDPARFPARMNHSGGGSMSTIDKQRIAAVRTLKAMGYVFRDEWIAPAGMTTTPGDGRGGCYARPARAARGYLEGSPEGCGIQGNRRRS